MHGYEINRIEALVTDLGRFIGLPEPIVTASTALHTVRGNQPTGATGDDIVAAYLRGDLEAVNRFAVARVIRHEIQGAHQAAVVAATRRLIGTIRAHADEIHAALRPQAETCIAALERAAAITEPLEVLVRYGRADDAKTVAAVAETGEALNQLYELRDNVYGKGTDYAGAGYLRNPECLIGTSGRIRPEETGWGSWYLDAIRRGGQLWYPSPQEAQDSRVVIVDPQFGQDDAA